MYWSWRCVKQPVILARYARSSPASVPQSAQSVTRQVWPDAVVATGPLSQPRALIGEWSESFHAPTSWV